jgi:hypothetical protein
VKFTESQIVVEHLKLHHQESDPSIQAYGILVQGEEKFHKNRKLSGLIETYDIEPSPLRLGSNNSMHKS